MRTYSFPERCPRDYTQEGTCRLRSTHPRVSGFACRHCRAFRRARAYPAHAARKAADVHRNCARESASSDEDAGSARTYESVSSVSSVAGARLARCRPCASTDGSTSRVAAARGARSGLRARRSAGFCRFSGAGRVAPRGFGRLQGRFGVAHKADAKRRTPGAHGKPENPQQGLLGPFVGPNGRPPCSGYA